MKPPAAVTAASSSQDTDPHVAFCARSVTHPLDALPHVLGVSAPWAAIRPRRDWRLH
ncbi:MAG TPA: hypothetical protein VKI99_14865 [Candidatus Dormibacteraeota bacterium]|nr:hypothetical protein [Candidatus Dormibacteraeota bacterium]